MMHKTKEGIQTPEWVEDGDYFYHPETKTYCMIVDADRNYYIPDTLTELSKADLIARVQEINPLVPIQIRTDEGKVALADEDVHEFVELWWDKNIT